MICPNPYGHFHCNEGIPKEISRATCGGYTGYHQTTYLLMIQERCVVLNSNDNNVRWRSKHNDILHYHFVKSYRL